MATTESSTLIQTLFQVEDNDNKLRMSTFSDRGTDGPLLSISVSDSSGVCSFMFEDGAEALAVCRRLVKSAQRFIDHCEDEG